MSARALRKLQREREEEQLRKLHQEQEEEDEEPAPAPAPAAKQSVFAMLDQEEPEAEDEDEGSAAEAHEEHPDTSEPEEKATATKSSAKRKKKKKRKGKGGKSATDTPTATTDSSVDEIDLALKSLSASSKQDAGGTEQEIHDSGTAEACRLLSVDSQHLHAANEMRRLFGRAALESEHNEEQNAGGRRRNRGGQQVGLAAALGRRQGAPGGRGSGLGLLGLRRNIFIQGKEEWPVATAGGLGMEIVEKRPDGTVEYRFVHNRAYQDVQGQFEVCVASMDPNRMIQLLQFNPYHISTLLQVSEIAKQERDHATSGDLLERALFSFGRAVHSTFATNLSQGKARLDFRRPENREFWLAAYRYISNLGMRATWRTVYEWAKLLLSLDPETDPYCIGLVIDQYALRARQPQGFLDLSSSAAFATKWKGLPNIQLSRGLALVQSGQAGKGKQALYTAVSRHPWVVSRLFQELNLDPPPGVWGKQPRTDHEKLFTELYATRAKDVWNTPEASSLLTEISSAVSSDLVEPSVVDTPISADEARHVFLTDTPALIALLPRSLTNKVSSSSDPLLPEDNLVSYTPSTRQSIARNQQRLGTPAENLRELQGLYGFFSNLFPWFNPTGETNDQPQMNEEEIERRIADSGISEEEIVQRTQRMMELQQRLMGAVDLEEAERPAGEHAGHEGEHAGRED
ncbi:hypothetical protein H2203_008309 [Taxawa tesnikishii (nom. ined.)]|nr:hypothetical protein H2203_008309 [Dothideales sp. JES 119]